jgi:hypothetical protein
LGGEKGTQFLWRNLFAGFLHHHGQRPLIPFRMPDRHHGRFGDSRVSHDGVFQVNRTDPFPTGLDQILGAV